MSKYYAVIACMSGAMYVGDYVELTESGAEKLREELRNFVFHNHINITISGTETTFSTRNLVYVKLVEVKND